MYYGLPPEKHSAVCRRRQTDLRHQNCVLNRFWVRTSDSFGISAQFRSLVLLKADK